MSSSSVSIKNVRKSNQLTTEEEDLPSRKFYLSPTPSQQLENLKEKSSFKHESSIDRDTMNSRHREAVQVVRESNSEVTAIEAIEMNELEVLKLILNKRPNDINQTDNDGYNLLSIGCRQGHIECVEFLAENYDFLTTQDTPQGYQPSHVCALSNQLECLKICFQNGASLTSKTNDGQTPLHLAAKM
jgi:ankyrin repeat protein